MSGRAAYTRAGVDVDAGERAVELMRASVASTRRPEVLGGLGGFGSAVAIPPGFREPVIVSSTDGVGTKTAIAWALGRYDTIGQDLVAMCADDVVCSGAEPLAFLDYVAVGRLDPRNVADLVAGVAEGCRQAGCALIGGETAEHPGLMEANEFDLAGFCIGVGERDRLLDGTAARAGDAIVGLASSGLHANGYSLVRALIAQDDLSTALAVLESLRQQAKAKGWADRLLMVTAVQSIALYAHGEKDKAMQLVGDSLALAEPGGFIRQFVDEGTPMAHLLFEAGDRGVMPDYVRKLLAVFDAAEKSEEKTSLSPAQPLIEPLSHRELEVLRLIAQGLSNREISERLFLALITVKGHNQKIFGKLQVQRRTEAVARARELGLL